VNGPDERSFDAIASSVGDGQPVDWNDVGATARLSDDPALVRELQVIARIGAFHRNPRRGAILPDHRIGERWRHLEILALLGAGSFGTVYRAHDPRLQRDVALKIYKGAEVSEQRATALFSEGRLLARIRNPNVVFVHGVEIHDGEVGLWLDLVDGRTLAEELRTAGPLGFREAALVGQDVCRALAAVHHEGLVHRDVKPQNVMRERGGRIVLMDFGLGRDLRSPDSESMDAGGTPLYMAPEVFDGRAASVASDIYSVGVLLFNLVTGSHPVVADSRADLAQAHREGRRRLLRDVRADLPDGFVDVVDRACAPDPSQRYATAGAMHAALAGVLGVSSSVSSASTDVRSATPRAGRWGLAAVLALAATVVTFVVVRQIPRTPEPEAVVPSAAATVPAPAPSSASADPDEYRIRAGFHRALPSGSTALEANARVRPGDRLFLEIEASRAVHVYVVNQDERGESYLLFPLPGQAIRNPLAGGQLHRLPGAVDWEVTSAGGREHFLVVASPQPLDALQRVFERLPAPRVGGPAAKPEPLSSETIGQLRGIGGLSPRDKPGVSGDLLQSAAHLGGVESVKGAWMRQFTLENPLR
jgi:serine/threonine protein kinase